MRLALRPDSERRESTAAADRDKSKPTKCAVRVPVDARADELQETDGEPKAAQVPVPAESTSLYGPTRPQAPALARQSSRFSLYRD
jgi:hypothetical protein